MGDVGSDGGAADDRRLGDLGVGAAARQELQDLAPARRELDELAWRVVVDGRGAGELVDDGAVIEEARSASPLAMTPTAAISSSGGASLSRKPLAPGAQRLKDVLVLAERGEDQDPRRCRGAAREPPGGLEAVHARHADVHEDHVWGAPLRGRAGGDGAYTGARGTFRLQNPRTGANDTVTLLP